MMVEEHTLWQSTCTSLLVYGLTTQHDNLMVRPTDRLAGLTKKPAFKKAQPGGFLLGFSVFWGFKPSFF